MKYSFIIQCTWKTEPLQEKTFELELSEEESGLLCNVAEEIKGNHAVGDACTKTDVWNPRTASGINMCDIDSLRNICEKILDKFFDWFKPKLCKFLKNMSQNSDETDNDECIDELFSVGWEEDLRKEGLSLSIIFPMELLYPPFIYKNKSCLTMANCFAFDDGTLLEELSKTTMGTFTPGSIYAFILACQKYWRQNNFKTIGQQQSSDNVNKQETITPTMIFELLDSWWLVYFFAQYSNGASSAPGGHPVDESDNMASYWRNNRKVNQHFGIRAIESSDASPVKIAYPDFCQRMRKVLFYRFFVDKKASKHINSLKYHYDIFKGISDTLPQPDPEERWYYEMCTGISLTLMITSLFIRLGINIDDIRVEESKGCYSWENCRRNVLLKVLEEYRPFIITCPAVYWRISMVEYALLNTNDEMRYNRFGHGPNITVEKEPKSKLSLVEWTESARRTFYRSYHEQCSYIQWAGSYLDGLTRWIRLPSTLIENTVKHFINEYQPGNFPTTPEKLNYMWDWFIYCPPEYYPYISEMQTEVEDISKVPYSNYRSTTKKQRIFEAVRNALYPDGFIDFET